MNSNHQNIGSIWNTAYSFYQGLAKENAFCVLGIKVQDCGYLVTRSV